MTSISRNFTVFLKFNPKGTVPVERDDSVQPYGDILPITRGLLEYDEI
jgi:hypothetical protein